MEDSTLSSSSEDAVEVVQQALDAAWLFVCLILVILMQPGFAAFEVGAIRASDTQSILLKNVGDATLGFVAWWVSGYAIASGKDTGHLTGRSYFFFTEEPFEPTTSESITATSALECLYGWAFAVTCTTIVSGAVADRIVVDAYFVYSFLTSAFFYPILAHAVWADEGWASTKTNNPLFGCGVIDYAGSGVVHMLGGGIGLLIARRVKSREGRFFESRQWHSSTTLKNYTLARQINEGSFRPNDPAWMTLGCFLLWLGWYGFNCGSGLMISTVAAQNTVGRAAINTTIGAAIACVASMVFEKIYHIWSPKYRRGRDFEDPLRRDPQNLDRSLYRANVNITSREIDRIRKHEAEHSGENFRWPFSTHKSLHAAACNGMLAGLVGITAGCATMSAFSAIGVSIVSALVYHVSYRGIICLKIDDAVNASAVHLFCGCWGLIAAGFTVTDTARNDLGYPDGDSCTRIAQFVTNAFMAVLILIWASMCTLLLFLILYCRDMVSKMQAGSEIPAVIDQDLCNFMEKTADQFELQIRKLDELEESQKKTENWIRELEANSHSQRESILRNIKELQRTNSMAEMRRRQLVSSRKAPGSNDDDETEAKDPESDNDVEVDVDGRRLGPDSVPRSPWLRIKTMFIS